MRLAISKAEQGVKNGQEPFGACIVRDGNVVSCAHNTVLETMDVTAHAEMNAIRDACMKLGTIDLSDCVIYATYEPCPMCRSACERAKISKIVYGAPSGTLKRRPSECQMEIVGNFLLEENLALLNSWSEMGA